MNWSMAALHSVQKGIKGEPGFSKCAGNGSAYRIRLNMEEAPRGHWQRSQQKIANT